MSVDVTSLVMDRYHIDEKQKEISRLENEIKELRKRLYRCCTHPTTKTDEKYSPGGYNHVSSVTVTKTCPICDKVLKLYDDPNHKGIHG